MNSAATQKTYLIVGGCGFLGKYIVDGLLNRGERNVRVFDLRKTFDDDRVKIIVGDITNFQDVKKACEGVDTVIHTASPTVQNQKYDFFYRVNVLGTQNVIDACEASSVKQLIYTSTSSVVFTGADIKYGDESLPYCSEHLDPYNQTKQLAEARVLMSNGKGGVMTCALRPSGIFGPKDVQAWPGFIGVAKEKILGRYPKSMLQIGNGKNLFDWTYVENVAHAHILASDRMSSGSNIGGEAYFITNGEPSPFWDMPKYIYQQFDYPVPSIFLPYAMMYYLSVLIAFIVTLLSPIVKLNPTFTPIRICNAGATKYFSIEKAKRDFGYKPIVTLEEGKKKTLEYFKKERKEGRI